MLEGIEKLYDSYDLGEYDERFRGKTITLLQNPTREFRNAFYTASAQYGSSVWLEMLRTILNVETEEQVEAIIGPLDMEVVVWLFVTVIDDWDEQKKTFGTNLRAHIFEVWDAYVRARVKKRAGR